MSTLYEELRQVIEGEVRFDPYSRSLYSTDASMYQIERSAWSSQAHGGCRRHGGTSPVATRFRAATRRWHQPSRADGGACRGDGFFEIPETDSWRSTLTRAGRVCSAVSFRTTSCSLRPLGFLLRPRYLEPATRHHRRHDWQ